MLQRTWIQGAINTGSLAGLDTQYLPELAAEISGAFGGRTVQQLSAARIQVLAAAGLRTHKSALAL